jgi:lipoyl(octanoyl) transferase
MCRVVDLGVVDYDEAFALQKRHVERLQRNAGDDVLMFVEHPHVITVGRNADGRAIVADTRAIEARGAKVVATDRGGDVTYHGPGQLVGYPIVRLEPGRRDIRRYVHDLEQVLIDTLADFGVDAARHPKHRGVWVEGRKIASLGIRISRWVTSHGFALNVSTDLAPFGLIVPCGIRERGVTSLERLLGRPVPLEEVGSGLARHLAAVFGRALA